MDNEEEKTKMTRWEPNEKDFYSPTEEEFHIGFEYFIQIDMWDMYKNRCWSKVTMDKLDRPTSGAKVKYLDREDIESLGWTIQETLYGVDCDTFTNLKSNFMFYNYTLHNCSISLLENAIIEGKNKDYFKTAFSGIINNKSELKKIMKQIEIDDTSSK